MAHTRRATTGVSWRLGFAGEPPQSKPSAPVCQDGWEPVSASGASPKFRIKLPLNGREVFLPALDLERVYRVTVEGVFRFWYKRSFDDATKIISADAAYFTDDLGNFLKRHSWLKLGGNTLYHFLENDIPEKEPHEDRQTHKYTFRIDGCTKYVSALFYISSDDIKWCQSITHSDGGLTLQIELLPENTPSPNAARTRLRLAEERARREAAAEEERTRSEKKAAAEKAKREEEELKTSTALQAQLECLRLQAHCESHFLDAEFQGHFARYHGKKILEVRKKQWDREYMEFMRDVRLKQLAEQEAPQVIEWFEARVKIVELAERIMVAPILTPEMKRAMEPKKKRTAEEIRRIKMRAVEVKADDEIEIAKLKATKTAKVRKELQTLDIDEAERETLETEATDRILQLGDQEEKNGSTL